MSTRRFELVDDSSSKFWEISQNDRSYTVCFGKIGTKGQSKTKQLEGPEVVSAEVAKLVKEKKGKGYVESSVKEQSANAPLNPKEGTISTGLSTSETKNPEKPKVPHKELEKATQSKRIRRFELIDEKSSKFWEISQDKKSYTICSGQLGTKGRSKTTVLSSVDQSANQIAELIRERKRKGYLEILSPLEKQRHDKIERDITEIKSACDKNDLMDALRVLRAKGVERLFVKENLYNDDGDCPEVIATMEGSRYSFDIGFNSTSVERFFRFDLNCNLNGTIAIADFDLVAGVARHYNHWADSPDLRIAEFIYYCKLLEVDKIECQLVVESDGFAEGFAVEFDRFLLYKKSNNLILIDKNSGNSDIKTQKKNGVRHKWNEKDLDYDYDEYSLFRFSHLIRGAFEVTPKKSKEILKQINYEINQLYRKISAVSETDDGIELGTMYCKQIVNACGHVVRLEIDVSNGVLRYSGDYGEAVQKINPEMDFKQIELEFDSVEFGSDKIIDPRCLSYDYEIQ
jgi:predicted DNA-binding WGR domain protein